MTCPFCQTDNPRGTAKCARCARVLERSIPAGTLLAGRYEVRLPLGRGGMSIVYDAYDRTRREIIALKIMQPGIGALPEMERRFATEIPMAARIRQANVCRILGCGEDDGLRYIAMEKIEGNDLARVLAGQGAFPAREAFDVAIQISRGVQALHAAGILHRDIKPKNIMYGADGRVRLMDFDIARQCVAGECIESEAGFGTPEYASPEQACGGAVDFRSDIYSLGVVIFEIFAGAVPFRGATSVETVKLHMKAPLPLEGPAAPRLPMAVIPVLRKALAKEPEHRYKNVRGLVAALRLAQSVTSPTGPTEAVRGRRRASPDSTTTTGPRRAIDPGLADAVPALLAALNERDKTVRWAEAWRAAPLDTATRAAIGALLETLSVRAGTSTPAAPDHAVAGLIETLGHSAANERARAVVALGDAGASALSAMPALLQALEDESVEVRREAAAALGKIVAAR
jgi:serine/threonine-protein kinase